MSSGIYYNQTVTTGILNGIAKDLGNTSFNGFTTNKFGADGLNKITKSLVTSGVLLSGNACEPTVAGDSVVIKSGVIVFENGAKIEITEAKTFNKTPSNVIYALNNVSEGTASLVMSDDYPESGMDFVKIASIDENGAVNDERKFATARVSFTANPTNIYTSKELDVPYIGNASSETERYIDAVIVNHSFNYIRLEFIGSNYSETVAVGSSDEIRISLETKSTTTVTADLIFRISGSTVRIYVSAGLVWKNVKAIFM